MACVVVPLAEAIAVTVVKKVLEKREQKIKADGTLPAKLSRTSPSRLSWSRKVSWLNQLLWGGVLLLTIEHVWHGEIVPWPPFLTAMNNSANIGPMLHEMAAVGTSMAIGVTIAWGILVFIADRKAKAIPPKVNSEALEG